MSCQHLVGYFHIQICVFEYFPDFSEIRLKIHRVFATTKNGYITSQDKLNRLAMLLYTKQITK